MKTLDKIYGSDLALTQVDSKPRVIGRNRTEIAVFLRPQSKGAVGCAVVIQYPFGGKLPAVAYHGFETPDSTQKLINSKNDRSITMPMSDHPVDIIDECAAKLAFIADCLSHTHQDCHVDLSPRGLNGLFYFITDLEAELRGASPRLCVKAVQL